MKVKAGLNPDLEAVFATNYDLGSTATPKLLAALTYADEAEAAAQLAVKGTAATDNKAMDALHRRLQYIDERSLGVLGEIERRDAESASAETKVGSGVGPTYPTRPGNTASFSLPSGGPYGTQVTGVGYDPYGGQFGVQGQSQGHYGGGLQGAGLYPGGAVPQGQQGYPGQYGVQLPVRSDGDIRRALSRSGAQPQQHPATSRLAALIAFGSKYGTGFEPSQVASDLTSLLTASANSTMNWAAVCIMSCSMNRKALVSLLQRFGELVKPESAMRNGSPLFKAFAGTGHAIMLATTLPEPLEALRPRYVRMLGGAPDITGFDRSAGRALKEREKRVELLVEWAALDWTAVDRTKIESILGRAHAAAQYDMEVALAPAAAVPDYEAETD